MHLFACILPYCFLVSLTSSNVQANFTFFYRSINPLDRCTGLQLNGQCSAPCAAGFSCVPHGNRTETIRLPVHHWPAKKVSEWIRSDNFDSIRLGFCPSRVQRVESKTLFEFTKESEPLSVEFRVVNQNPSNAHINEGYFEVSRWPSLSLRLAKPIQLATKPAGGNHLQIRTK